MKYFDPYTIEEKYVKLEWIGMKKKSTNMNDLNPLLLNIE